MEPFIFYQPTKIRIGRGISEEIGNSIRKHGTRCLIVTYHPSKLSPAQNSFNEKIETRLIQSGVEIIRFQGAIPNPSSDCVDEGYKIAKDEKIDVILAIGGGSAIDTAKMIGFRVTNENIGWDHLFTDFSNPFPNEEPYCKQLLPLIAIPTTSGTGSQVTQAAVITNTVNHQKTSIFHSFLFPKEAIIDPELMLSVPASVTGDTGFDAFCHAFESFINKRASPFSEMISLEAIRLIFKWLPEAVEHGNNL
ncbi:MAG: iron-containing alcohol dehydrogenase, partial [Bacillota bacterium]